MTIRRPSIRRSSIRRPSIRRPSSDRPEPGHRRASRRLTPRRIAAVAAAAVVAGGVATAAVLLPGPPAFASVGPVPAGSPALGLAGPGPWGPGWTRAAGAGGPWWAGGSPWGGWPHPSPAHAELFHVVSTNPAGPGAIVVTGVVNAGGSEHPGRAVDQATFAGGSFHIDHATGRPTQHFDPTTCVGTITQTGPFQVTDATGTMSALAGHGRYVFRALYTTARVDGRCSTTMTAYTETIDGEATVEG